MNSIYPLFSPAVIDYSKITRWISSRETEHDQESGTTIDNLTWFLKSKDYTLRLIDVQKKCVTVANSGARYIALSYFWGGIEQLQLTTSNYAFLSTKGSLARDGHGAETLQTIHDAIDVALRAGERYLWCDALCIKQDQIRNMHKIYNNAAWCLAVATSAHAGEYIPRIGQ
jgi:hypothetical protein